MNNETGAVQAYAIDQRRKALARHIDHIAFTASHGDFNLDAIVDFFEASAKSRAIEILRGAKCRCQCEANVRIQRIIESLEAQLPTDPDANKLLGNSCLKPIIEEL